MEYLKLQRSFRKTDAWGAASMNNRGVWTSLAGYCADEENGGCIRGARKWPLALWQRRIGCTQDELTDAIDAGMAAWDGDDLVVAGYDVIGEQHYQAKRARAKDAGAASGEARKKQPRAQAPAQPQAEPHGSTTRFNHTVQPNGQPPAPPPAEAPAQPQAEPILHSPSPMDQETGQRRPARERAPSRRLPPAVVVAVSLGARIEGDDGIDLVPRWENALANLTEDRIRQVFAAAPRLLTHEAQYPNTFRKALHALVAEEGARTEAEEQDQRDLERATELQRCQMIAERVRAWLKSDDGAKVRVKLTGLDRDAIAMLGDSASSDGGLYGFLQVARKHPDLEHIAAKASEDWRRRGAA